MANGLIGRKLGMTRVFAEDGVSVPVTVIEAGPCRVVQVKADAVLKGNDLARLPRLSVIPFSEAQYKRLLELANE